MILFPNCKINLGLHITARRPDGFHEIETLFYPVSGLRDAVEVLPDFVNIFIALLRLFGDRR